MKDLTSLSQWFSQKEFRFESRLPPSLGKLLHWHVIRLTVVNISRPFIYAFLLIFLSSRSVSNEYLFLVNYSVYGILLKQKKDEGRVVSKVMLDCSSIWIHVRMWFKSSTVTFCQGVSPFTQIMNSNIVGGMNNNIPRKPPSNQTEWGQVEPVKSLRMTVILKNFCLS